MVAAVIRSWNADEGWGVIDSPATPGGCWAHFSSAAVPGVASFTPGQAVELEFESPGQDGYPYRAVRLQPAGATPTGRAPAVGGGAYSSTLTLSFDEPATP
ncbi:cold-shock protein [Catenuloplanes sp. NPDC051500]|uniref:cold-shock protein n=1 Tax=Catenuloplanes sp. NPDC051500 TaxID=3363959 RepID=UPI00378881FE